MRRFLAAASGGRRAISWAGPVLLAVVLAACGRPEAATSAPPRHRLLFIGIDGATWTLMGPLIERGELPTFARLMREGASMPRFSTMETTRSPIVWTTIATGREPAVHGIEDFAVRLGDGTLIPATGNQRRARAIWEVASRKGLRVGVVGWWATWPAETVNGYVVSDHANPAFIELMSQDGRWFTADPQRLAAAGLDYTPADLGPLLARHWIDGESFPWAELQRRGGFSDEQVEALRAAPWNSRNVHSWLKMFFRVDYPLMRIAVDLAAQRPSDLQLVYLRGPDPVQHYGWDLVEPQLYARPPAHLERDRGLVPGVYRYLDTFVAELMATQRPGDWLIVASDHGAEASPKAQFPQHMTRPGEHPPGAAGVLFLHGDGVKAGYRLDEADPYDLFPTMAWLLGLPLSDELPGEPLFDAFDRDFVRARPVHTVDSYGPRPPQPLKHSPSDEALIDNLRSLGYIE